MSNHHMPNGEDCQSEAAQLREHVARLQVEINRLRYFHDEMHSARDYWEGKYNELQLALGRRQAVRDPVLQRHRDKATELQLRISELEQELTAGRQTTGYSAHDIADGTDQGRTGPL